MNEKISKKNFDGWNTQKKITDERENKKTFHEREAWFIKIGEKKNSLSCFNEFFVSCCRSFYPQKRGGERTMCPFISI